MAEFEGMLKTLGELHNAEVFRYKNEIANLHNELERCKKELSIAMEEKLKQNEVFERTKIKLSMKSQETRQLRDLLLKYDISAPPTNELVDISQKNGSKKAETPLISISTPSSSTIPVSSLNSLTSPVCTTVQDCVPVVTPTTSTHCSTCVTHCTMTSSIISSCATENNQASRGSGFISARSSPPNRKALQLHRRKQKIIYGRQKIRDSSRDDNELRVGQDVNMKSVSLSEDGSYNQDKNPIGPENQTKDLICNDDLVLNHEQTHSSQETSFVPKVDVGSKDHCHLRDPYGGGGVPNAEMLEETCYGSDHSTKISSEKGAFNSPYPVSNPPTGTDFDISSVSFDWCSPSLLRTSPYPTSDSTEENAFFPSASSCDQAPPPSSSSLAENGVLTNNGSSISDGSGVSKNGSAPPRKRKKLQTTITQAFGSNNSDYDTSDDDSDGDIILIPCTLPSPKPDTFTSNFTTGRDIIPPTPWVRPKTSLTSGWQKQLLDSGRAKEIETFSGGDVTRASLDETVALFREPSQSEEEASSQQAGTGSSTPGTGIESPKTSKTLTYAQQIAKKSGLPTYKCSVVIKKKEDRAKLDGKACPECAKWFKEGDGIYGDQRNHLRKTCRHKKLYHPPDSDPSLWNISFPPDESNA